MNPKTWLKIKRGLLEPEHRERMGVRVWLYMYIIDNVNWETGTIEDWTDQKAADDFGMEIRTLQSQRQQLQADGYISCKQIFQAQRIIVHNWTNPREYSGRVINEKSEDGYTPDVTIENHGTRNTVPHDTQSRVPIPTENRVPFHIDHTLNHIEDHNKDAAEKSAPLPLTDGLRFTLEAFGAKRFKTVIQKETLKGLEKTYGTERLKEIVTWAAKKGMGLGQAIPAIEKAIPGWGKPKPVYQNGNGNNGHHPTSPQTAYDRSKAALARVAQELQKNG